MNILPSNTPQYKTCTKCGRTFPHTNEYFSLNGKDRKGNPSGLRPDCKECRSKKAKAHYSQPEVKQQRSDYAKAYRAEHQEYVRAQKKAYYNQPEIKERRKASYKIYREEYYQRPGTLEQKRTQAKEYVSRPEVKEHHRAYDRVFQHRRRDRKRASTEHYTLQQLHEQYDRQRGKCYYCHVKVGKVFQADHVVPLSRGGSNDISNIVVACPSCNQHKQARSPHEWPEGGRLL